MQISLFSERSAEFGRCRNRVINAWWRR